jgi:D-alanyl-D-alanine carboxypeptidase/D-alanyl-D-alanine-endopeptidase (penicillin-binding protein 4)
VLEGSLFIKGYGDPKLTLESMWLLARALRERGLSELRGDLVLDRSHFDASGYDPARFDGEPLRPYNVGPDALLVSFKSVRFLFVPDASRGVVRVLASPHPRELELVNALKLTEGGCNDWRERMRAEFQPGPAAARAAFSGEYPRACGEREWNVALLAHPVYAAAVFREVWAAAGGAWTGGMREGPVPPTAQLLYRHESAALAEIVRDINKYSNNVMARQLYLTLGAGAGAAPARLDGAFQAVREWLAAKRLAMPELVIDNGSGLSRIERISAHGLAALLQSAYRSAVMPEFIASLPLVAVDGTMRRRLRNGGTAGQAHIKTGTLHDVRSIAGYVLDREGRRHVVVMIVNHPNAARAQAAQDALLAWVYEGGAPAERRPPGHR